MENDRAAERHLDQIRHVLVRDEELPLGLVSRVEAAVRRDQMRDEMQEHEIGWEVRVGVACVCFVAVGLSSREAMSAQLAVVLAVIALLYPWTVLRGHGLEVRSTDTGLHTDPG
jgi:hypothetical protein